MGVMAVTRLTLVLVGRRFTFQKQVRWSKEGNVVFNDAPNAFYLRLNGVEYMAKE